jgi:hemolysin activation/secretion protein
MKILLGLTLALLMAAMPPWDARAQDIPGVAEQQRLLDRFEDSPFPKSTFEEDTRATGEPITRAEAERHRFTLQGVKFLDMKRYGAEELLPLYEAMLETEISFADILDLAEKIEENYAEDGKTTARVLLKKRPGSNGKVTLLVIEKR